MKYVFAILGGLGITNFITFLPAIRGMESMPKAIVAGSVLIAIALFSGLCFVAVGVIVAGEKAATGVANQTHSEVSERKTT